MKAIAWSEDLRVGIPELDDQHRQLVELAARFASAARGGQGRRMSGEILASLESYAATHFAAEEAFMERCGYPQLERHRRQHGQLIAKLTELRQRHQAGQRITGRVAELLRYWVHHHIAAVDRDIGDHARRQADAGSLTVG
jgi:hemerythrin-like metal-binding protein